MSSLRDWDTHFLPSEYIFKLPVVCRYDACVFLFPAIQTSIHQRAMVGIKVVSVGSMRPKGKSYDIEVFRVSRQNAENRRVRGS